MLWGKKMEHKIEGFAEGFACVMPEVKKAQFW